MWQCIVGNFAAPFAAGVFIRRCVFVYIGTSVAIITLKVRIYQLKSELKFSKVWEQVITLTLTLPLGVVTVHYSEGSQLELGRYRHRVSAIPASIRRYRTSPILRLVSGSIPGGVIRVSIRRQTVSMLLIWGGYPPADGAEERRDFISHTFTTHIYIYI